MLFRTLAIATQSSPDESIVHYRVIPSRIKSLVQGNSTTRYRGRSSSRFELSKKSSPEPPIEWTSLSNVRGARYQSRSQSPQASWSAGGPSSTVVTWCNCHIVVWLNPILGINVGSDIHSYTQPYIAIHSYTWLYTAIHVYTQLYMVIHDYTQLYIAIHRYT